MADIVTIGWLTVDDIVLVDGTCKQGVVGGGATYSAVGASIFCDSVAIYSVCGKPYFNKVVDEIAKRGIDCRSIKAIEGNGLELWLLHESEVHKQQVPKLTSSAAQDMDQNRGPLATRLRNASGFHIAPQTPAGSIANALDLSTLGGNSFVTMDILSDRFIDAGLYEDLSFLAYLDVFMPSEAEIARIWKPPNLENWLVAHARESQCHMVAKLGEKGSLLAESKTGRLHHIPALPVSFIDTTGAGDAYCGGFIAGLVAGKPPTTCAAMGTVAASYVIQSWGALETKVPSSEEKHSRLAQALSGIRSWNS